MLSTVQDNPIGAFGNITLNSSQNTRDHKRVPPFLIQDPGIMSKGLARNCSQVTRLEASLLTQNLHDEISEEESTSQPNTPDALDGPHSGNHCDQVQDSRSTNQSSTMVKQIVERQNHLIWQAYDAWRRKFPRPLDETEEQMVAISTEKLRNSATNSVVSKNDSRSLTCMLQPV